MSVEASTQQTQQVKSHNPLLLNIDVSKKVRGGFDESLVEELPSTTRARFERHGVDLSKGYPEKPPSDQIPLYVDDAFKIRDKPQEYIPRGKFADRSKKALFSKAKEFKHLTKYIGTEIVGVQLSDLNEQELDELALLIAERVVVFFKDQDLSPQKQLELGAFFGNVEIHPQFQHVPGLPGTSVIWDAHFKKNGFKKTFKTAKTGTSNWHADLTHELQPPSVTHLHLDAIPSIGGDTNWSSGYAAYDKLSPAFQKFLEGKVVTQKSMHGYLDRNDPLGGPKHVIREQPIIRTNPITGWKSLFVSNGASNLDIQVRFNWHSDTGSNLGTSALWDNRIGQHNATWDYEDEDRHGTRVSSLAEIPYFDPNSKSQRESLGL
ncbi:Alpha-ketoglutarate-dependent sulfonate dioxygenase [Wickerhamomyces ciferrii]|uniref:Alpha-ketoglutarate-dependent sulfonate dioxygenase n=1 Tax=Wickerhamomyces ciferrii (strain ATCC 14091 / BCRC 22168 / CBS 111 / JCM 3599 / NBRC 0793 / NRRL Y-1031 F-60-10) TaxID=1206466 RepID=K0KF85_WICCF|nr:Alpha-ketoglutarate-dependent sulfonate dioxygenase [Wickerhamomyces ciferrii]CCH40887.1 Alpha-ketoglutarate-dependent sulfonate dioxygenase [Wickerhamomyces ciferrii]